MKKIILGCFASLLLGSFVISCNNQNTNFEEKIDSAIMPEIVFTEQTFDFGTIHQGDTVAHDFVFTNQGKTPLTILDAVPSCGCTTPQFTKTAIAPNEKGTIHVMFNSTNFSGKVLKTVQVVSNAKRNLEMIHLEGNIIPINK